MRYFNETDDTPTKIGKAIGDAISLVIYLGVAGLMLYAALLPFMH
jgi:hypothetical protein